MERFDLKPTASESCRWYGVLCLCHVFLLGVTSVRGQDHSVTYMFYFNTHVFNTAHFCLTEIPLSSLDKVSL